MTFDDINFTPHECGGIKGKLKVNEHTVSVLGGFGFYSEPRENLTTPDFRFNSKWRYSHPMVIGQLKFSSPTFTMM